jgi:GAF domain-containing protein/CheY-like chemotaxis protein
MPRRRKVLLIDDSPEDLATYSAHLLSSEENTLVVATASSSATGLQLCTVFQPDCLVIDLHIDALDGLAVLERARERAGYVPTIILTGQGSERLAVESLKRGAWNYLVKGETTPAALAEAVHEALDARSIQHELKEQRRKEERARAELEAAYGWARFLAGISQILISSLERETIVETVVREVIAEIADACFVDLLVDRELTRIGAAVQPRSAAPDESRAHVAPDIDGREGVARVMRTGEAALYGPSWLDTVVPYDAELARLVQFGLHSAVVVPLAFDRSVFGAVTFAALGSRPAFCNADTVHFMEFGRRLSAAIVNADLYAAERRARTAAESAKRRLTIVSQASSLFARSLDWRETLRRLTGVIVPRFADWAGIFVLDIDDPPATARVCSQHSTAALGETYARLFEPLLASLGPISESGAASRVYRPEYYPAGLPQSDASTPPSVTQAIDRLRSAGVRSYMSVPLVARGQHLGSLVVLDDRERPPFELDDLSLLEDLGRRIATFLETASISRREREIAHTLQRSLLPDTIPAFSELGFATRYLPGTEGVHVGGDWYDAIAVNDRCVAFVIGDVSGRGVRAAAIMGKLRATVRAYLLDGFGPAAVLERSNRASESMGSDHFATVLCAILDRNTGSLTFANAGHPPPILIGERTCTVLDAEPGPPIGVVRTAEYSDVTVRVDAGATFLLYTDGLVESRKRFASDGIVELCEHAKTQRDDLELFVDHLLAAMTGGLREDDVALVAVRRLSTPHLLERTG